MYRLTCPCGNDLVVTTRQAGSRVTCDACQRSLEVPKLGDLRQLPRAEVATDRAEEATQQGLSGLRGTAFASCMVLAFAAGSVSIVAGLKGFSGQLPPTVDEYIAAHRNEIDSLPPHEMVSLWEEYVENGLGPKTTPQFEWDRKVMLRWRLACGIALAVTLAGIAGAVIAGRRPKHPVAES